MRQEFANQEEKIAYFQKLLEEASQNPISLQEFHRLIKEQERTDNGRILVATPQDLRLIMELSDTYCPITKEYIDEQVNHETQHIEEAKKLYQHLGDTVKYFYGFQFLTLEDNSLASVPLFEVHIPSEVEMDEETYRKTTLQIIRAPAAISTGDKLVIKESVKEK